MLRCIKLSSFTWNFFNSVYTYNIRCSGSICTAEMKTRQQIPFYYSSSTVHLINKLTSKTRQFPACDHSFLALELDRNLELDKLCYLNSFANLNVNNCFKILKCIFNKCTFPGTFFWGSFKARTILEKSNLFNRFFASVFKPSCSVDVIQLYTCSSISLNSIDISFDKILNFLSSADDSSSVCCDNVPPAFLRYCSNQLCPLGIALYENILKHKVWPDAWKTAYVSPLHKKESCSDVTNYRPISLLPKLSQV